MTNLEALKKMIFEMAPREMVKWMDTCHCYR